MLYAHIYLIILSIVQIMNKVKDDRKEQNDIDTNPGGVVILESRGIAEQRKRRKSY